MTPVRYDCDLISFNPVGATPSANSRLPLPSSRGNVRPLTSPTRPWLHNVCTKLLEPCTSRSGPSSLFSFSSAATTFSPSHWLLFQVKSDCERDATYFV